MSNGTELAKAWVKILVDRAHFAKELSSARSQFASGVGSMSTGLRGVLGVASAVVASLGGIRLAMAAASKGLSLASQAEDTQMAFESLLGSANRAKTVIGELRTFSRTTPFQETETIGAGRSLLNAGVHTSKLTQKLRELGDISAGSGQRIEMMALIYQQVANKGRLMQEEMLQFAGRGVPIIEALAQALGKSRAEVMQLASDGKLGLADLDAAFAALTGEGGKFHNLTNSLSTKMSGRYAALQDEIDAFARTFGTLAAEGADVNGILVEMTELVKELNKQAEDSSDAWEGFFSDIGAIIKQDIQNLEQLLELAAKEREPDTPESVRNRGAMPTFSNLNELTKLFGFDFSDIGPKWERPTLRQEDRPETSSPIQDPGRDAAAKAQEKWASTLKATLIANTETPLEKLKRQMGELRRLLETGAIGPELYSRGVRMLNKEFREGDPILKAMRETYEATRTPLEKFQQQMAELGGMVSRGLDPETARRRAEQIHKEFRESDDPIWKRRRELEERAKETNERHRSPEQFFKEEMAKLYEMRGLLTPEAFRGKEKEILDETKGMLADQERERMDAAMNGMPQGGGTLTGYASLVQSIQQAVFQPEDADKRAAKAAEETLKTYLTKEIPLLEKIAERTGGPGRFGR